MFQTQKRQEQQRRGREHGQRDRDALRKLADYKRSLPRVQQLRDSNERQARACPSAYERRAELIGRLGRSRLAELGTSGGHGTLRRRASVASAEELPRDSQAGAQQLRKPQG